MNRRLATVFALTASTLMGLALLSAVVLAPRIDRARAAPVAREATALLRAGHRSAALTKADEALRLDADNLDALVARANALAGMAGREREALQALERVILASPGSAWCWTHRGWLRLRIGELAGARHDLDRALALRPRDATAWRLRGEVRQRTGDCEGAEADLTQAIALEPAAVVAYRSRRDLRRSVSQYAPALADATTVVELEPRSAEAWWYRAWVRESLGELELALQDSGHALELAPFHEGAMLVQGSVLTSLGRHDAAVQTLEIHAERSDHPYANVALARALAARGADGDLARARTLLDEVVDHPGAGALALGDRAALRGRLGDPEGELADARLRVERAPAATAGWCALGKVLSGRARHEEALAAYDRACALQPANGSLVAQRWRPLFDLGRFAEAAAACDEAIALTPGADTHAHRYALRARRGDFEGALADIAQARRLGGGDADLAYASAQALLLVGRLDEALAEADALLAMRPDDVRGLGIIATTRLRSGDIEGALAACEAAIRAHPQAADARVQRATVRFELGDLEGCDEDASAAILLDASAINARVMRSGVRRSLGDLAGALVDAEAILKAEPDNPLGLQVRGITLLELGREDEAERDITRSLAACPGSSSGWLARAELHAKRDEGALAVEAATRALALHPRCPQALVTRARALMEDDPDRARDDLERFLAEAPRRPEALRARVMLERLR